MPSVSHLRALQALELAIRKGSLKEAARELAITPAAIGQRIRALEDYLGYDLLVRGRSGTRPTPELESALAHLAAGFRELDTVARILDFQRVNEIHISADPDWAELWLKPRLPAFRADNPNTLFCINGVGDVPVRLGQSDFDIRFAAAGEDDDILFHDYLLPVSSPTNTRRVAALPKDTRLEGFPLLHLDSYLEKNGGIGWPEWIGRFGYRKTAPGLGIRYRRVVHALEAVFADSGFILCGLALIAPMLDADRLEILFPIVEGEWTSHAYCLSGSHESRRREQTERFRRWLKEQAALTRADLDQRVGASAAR
ncbi:MAG: LysR family transcriptional regulator [Pseudomonadota bacterium]